MASLKNTTSPLLLIVAVAGLVAVFVSINQCNARLVSLADLLEKLQQGSASPFLIGGGGGIGNIGSSVEDEHDKHEERHHHEERPTSANDDDEEDEDEDEEEDAVAAESDAHHHHIDNNTSGSSKDELKQEEKQPEQEIECGCPPGFEALTAPNMKPEMHAHSEITPSLLPSPANDDDASSSARHVVTVTRISRKIFRMVPMQLSKLTDSNDDEEPASSPFPFLSAPSSPLSPVGDDSSSSSLLGGISTRLPDLAKILARIGGDLGALADLTTTGDAAANENGDHRVLRRQISGRLIIKQIPVEHSDSHGEEREDEHKNHHIEETHNYSHDEEKPQYNDE